MAIINYITDGEDFLTVDASTSTLIATALPQGAVDFYNPSMVVDTWYRYYSLTVETVYNKDNALRIFTNALYPQTGIMQKLSGLTIGNVYSIELNNNTNLWLEKTTIYIYSGTVLQSTHSINGKALQKIQFIANSTEDTILIDSKYLTTMNRLELNSIKVFDTTPSISVAPGFDSKPLAVSLLGNVTFSAGKDSSGAIMEVTPNQAQCEAYGYTYNRQTGTCSSYNLNTSLDFNVANENNRTYGMGNSTETGTNNTYIMGENNVVRGFSRNGIITGSGNAIGYGVNNAKISGVKGEATASNSVVLGGNAPGDSLGFKQSIELMCGRQTITSGWVTSYLNNTTGSFFNIPDNTAMYFHAEVLGVRVGGTGTGNPGDFASFVERGVIINKSGVTSISRERDAIKSSGTVTTWLTRSSVSAANTNFILEVKGAANVTIEWASTIRFTQIKTGVTL